MPCWPAPCWCVRITNWWQTSRHAPPRCGSSWTTVTGTTKTSATSLSASCTTTSRCACSRTRRKSAPPAPPSSPAPRRCPCPTTSPGTCSSSPSQTVDTNQLIDCSRLTLHNVNMVPVSLSPQLDWESAGRAKIHRNKNDFILRDQNQEVPTESAILFSKVNDSRCWFIYSPFIPRGRMGGFLSFFFGQIMLKLYIFMYVWEELCAALFIQANIHSWLSWSEFRDGRTADCNGSFFVRYSDDISASSASCQSVSEQCAQPL